MKEGEVTGTLTHESFAAIGNETRMEILQVLWLHRSLSFSELFDLIQIEDTGHFSYHLNQLRGHFVDQSGEEYRLTNAAKEIVMTILAHVETENPLRDPHRLSSRCHGCDSQIQAVSSSGWLRIDCGDCEKLYASFPIPMPGLADRSPTACLRVYDQWIRRMYGFLHRGSCPNCCSPTQQSIVHDAEPDPGLPFVFMHLCAHCHLEIYSVPGTSLLENGQVVAFYAENQADLYTIPHWELPWLFDGRCIEIVSDDPFRYQIDITIESENLHAILDASGEARTISGTA